ncbi:MAG: hypothetical protein OXU36_03335 [Candidatus Poribacteria bacterium]|nr:hypothetical protein [Candidatus Poribacteria bacterium]
MKATCLVLTLLYLQSVGTFIVFSHPHPGGIPNGFDGVKQLYSSNGNHFHQAYRNKPNTVDNPHKDNELEKNVGTYPNILDPDELSEGEEGEEEGEGEEEEVEEEEGNGERSPVPETLGTTGTTPSTDETDTLTLDPSTVTPPTIGLGDNNKDDKPTSRRSYNYTYCTDEGITRNIIQIVDLEELKKPKRLLVTFRNNTIDKSIWSGRPDFVDLAGYSIALVGKDGIKFIRYMSAGVFRGRSYITYQKSGRNKHAETRAILTSKWFFDKGKINLADDKARIGIYFNYNTGKNKVEYIHGEDKLVLLYDCFSDKDFDKDKDGKLDAEKIMSEYRHGQDEVQMAPQLHRTLTTSWGSMKK